MKETRRDLIRKAPFLAGLLAGSNVVSASESDYPSWDPNTVYRSGDRVVHGGIIWEAQWWSRGDEPSESVSVWNRIGTPGEASQYPAWDPNTVYRSGDRVVHNGHAWEAQWWSRGDEPSESGRRNPWHHLYPVESDEPADDEPTGDEPTGDEEPASSPPAAPTGLTVTNVDATSITLEWNHESSDTVAAYRVYGAPSDQVDASEEHLLEETSEETYTDSGLSEGTTYSYTVSAVDGDGVEGSASSTVSETTDESAPERSTDDRVVAYYTSWSRYNREYYPADVPLDKLTHLTYAFLDVESNGEVVYGDEHADPQNLGAFRDLKAEHPDTRMLLSIGGWSLSGHFSDAAATQENRERFARTAIDLMRQYDFDGIDVDWEYPDGGGAAGNTERPDDPDNFVLLLEEVRRQLDEAEQADDQTYELSIAGATNPRKSAALDVPAIADVVDYVSVMNYDYAGTWSSETNHNSKLYSAANDPSPDVFNAHAGMQGWADQGMPKDKLVFGLAFFGWGFQGVPDQNAGLYQSFSGAADVGWSEQGATDYEYVSNLLESNASYERYWDDEAKVPWVYSSNDNVFITYEDPESIGIKAEYVRENEYGGVMAWELYGDRNETLLDEIRTTLDS